jgi:trans-aconitate methyltransferase
MPYSEPTFDNKIRNFLSVYPGKTYLDIGAGAGKYGKMIRQINPLARIIAVEVNKKFINQFKLREIYDEIYAGKIEAFVAEKTLKEPRFIVDTALIGDCLEHLKKSAGLDLLHYLIYRTKYIIVVFPSKWVQYDWQGHVYEAHQSVWWEKDFEIFSHQYQKVKHMNLVIIQGYLADPEALITRD